MCVLCVSSISCFFVVTNSCLALHICQDTLQDMLKPFIHNDGVPSQHRIYQCIVALV